MLLIPASVAHAACSCAWAGARQSMQLSVATFAGRVTEAPPPSTRQFPPDASVARLIVSQPIKGGRTNDTLSIADPYMCGVGFGIGERWLVFAQSERPQGTGRPQDLLLETNLCLATTPLRCAAP